MLLTPEYKKELWEKAYTEGSHLPKNMRRATMALFWEYRNQVRWKQRGITPLFTLKPKDNNGCLSFPQMYFQCDSEYEFAMIVLGDWKHWERLLATPWFMDYLEAWREEKEQRDIAFARAKIKELARNGNLAACKHLESGGKPKPTTKKPSKSKPETPEPGENNTGADEWLDKSLANIGE